MTGKLPNVADAGASPAPEIHPLGIGHIDEAGAPAPHGDIGAPGGALNVLPPGSAGVIGLTGADTIGTGANSAGNGGGGHVAGAVVHTAAATFEPGNLAEGAPQATVAAQQTNALHLDQSAVQIAGTGGNGGSGNSATGGHVTILEPSPAHSWAGPSEIATGGNHAGSGGNGSFTGVMVDSATAIFHPVNIAVGGPHATADAHQTNSVFLDQSATQVAGVGGDGGDNNSASGGAVSIFGLAHALYGLIGSDVIATGGNSAGSGGDGSFSGSIAHVAFALYDPIIIAVAGPNSGAEANQSNVVDINQSAIQIAGVGGHGGDGNTAAGGNARFLSSGAEPVGSSVVVTGANSAGDGGGGHATGSLTDVSVAVYAPINIAVGGHDATAIADQNNNVHFDQGAIQIAGIGGAGGNGNEAHGGDFALQLLADHHLPFHIV